MHVEGLATLLHLLLVASAVVMCRFLSLAWLCGLHTRRSSFELILHLLKVVCDELGRALMLTRLPMEAGWEPGGTVHIYSKVIRHRLSRAHCGPGMRHRWLAAIQS